MFWRHASSLVGLSLKQGEAPHLHRSSATCWTGLREGTVTGQRLGDWFCPGSLSWRIMTLQPARLPWGPSQQKGSEARALSWWGGTEAAPWIFGHPRKPNSAGGVQLGRLRCGWGAWWANANATRGMRELVGKSALPLPMPTEELWLSWVSEKNSTSPTTLQRQSRHSDEPAPARQRLPRCNGPAPASSPAPAAMPDEALCPQGCSLSCFQCPHLPFPDERSRATLGRKKRPWATVKKRESDNNHSPSTLTNYLGTAEKLNGTGKAQSIHKGRECTELCRK